MIVDVHTHIGETKFTDDVITVEKVLRAMDEAGIDKAVVIPGVSTGRIIPAERVAEEVRRAPDRLVPFASVNPKEKNAVIKLEEAVVKYGAKGLFTNCSR